MVRIDAYTPHEIRRLFSGEVVPFRGRLSAEEEALVLKGQLYKELELGVYTDEQRRAVLRLLDAWDSPGDRHHKGSEWTKYWRHATERACKLRTSAESQKRNFAFWCAALMLTNFFKDEGYVKAWLQEKIVFPVPARETASEQILEAA